MKKAIMISLLAVTAIVLLIVVKPGGTVASEDEKLTFLVKGNQAEMTGVIDSDTPKAIEKLLKEHPNLTTIVMKNVPGSMDDEANLKASLLVRQHGLNTVVPKDGMIASGGTDFFLAGVKRTVEEGAKVGVHSWASDSIDNASLLPKNDLEHKKYLDYYEAIGIPASFYWFTIEAAVASDMHWMTHEEMVKYQMIEENK